MAFFTASGAAGGTVNLRGFIVVLPRFRRTTSDQSGLGVLPPPPGRPTDFLPVASLGVFPTAAAGVLKARSLTDEDDGVSAVFLGGLPFGVLAGVPASLAGESCLTGNFVTFDSLLLGVPTLAGVSGLGEAGLGVATLGVAT